jgi:spoIIIJ-associated protein
VDRKDKPLADGALFVEHSIAPVNSMSPAERPAQKPTPEKAESAADLLREVLYRMDIEADVNLREVTDEIVLDVDGPDAGRAIGKKGATLDALQFLMNKIVNREPDGRCHVVVDSGDYRQRYDERLEELATREAERAVEMARVVTLRPMSPRDRRVVHESLKDFTGVRTQSAGEGLGRRIQIIPEGLKPRPIRRRHED